jgi:hypothetical protein
MIFNLNKKTYYIKKNVITRTILFLTRNFGKKNPILDMCQKLRLGHVFFHHA